ncbi:uncharacterized protein LOC135489914 [Lineus longissimus]|uniref:uncharacterized protein LOC135489914 n=1 Tax=Lineus longissimus TaxID=88925 RepID=UPI00315CD216
MSGKENRNTSAGNDDGAEDEFHLGDEPNQDEFEEDDQHPSEDRRQLRSGFSAQMKGAELKQLSRSRSALTGRITAKKNCLSRLMEGTDTDKVKTILRQMKELMDKFLGCHNEYQARLPVKERERDQAYCDTRLDDYEQFEAEVAGWLDTMVVMETEGLTQPETSRGVFGRIDVRALPFTPAHQSTRMSDPLPPDLTQISNVTQATERALSDIADTQRDLTKQMRIPRAEPEIFDGDETKFREFFIDFQEYVAKWTDTDRERLTQLRAYTSGTPHELVRGCVHLRPEEGYADALRLLETRYGAPYDTSRAYIRKISAWPKLSMKAAEDMERFAILLRDSLNALTGLGRLTELEHPSMMAQIVDKLPDCLRYKWIRQDTEIFTKTGNPANYQNLVKFIEAQAKVVMNPRYGTRQRTEEGPKPYQGERKQDKSRSNPGKQAPPKAAFRVTSSSERSNDKPGEREDHCSYCKELHKIQDCMKLKKLPRPERGEFLKKTGRSFKCLERGHIAKDHGNQSTSQTVVKPETPSSVNKSEAVKSGEAVKTVKTEEVTSRRIGTTGRIAMAVLPVKLRSLDNGVEVTTNVFLDNGAGASFITDGLATKRLEVKGLSKGDEWIKLNELFTHSTIPIKPWEIPTENDVRKYPELKKVDLKVVNHPVEILFGANQPEITRPVEIISTKEDGPYAMRTKIGWTLLGPVQRGRMNIASRPLHRLTVEELNNNMNAHFSREFDDGSQGEEIRMSREEERFMAKLRGTTAYTGERYQVRLPLKDQLPAVPESRPMAERRLSAVLKRMKRDKNYATAYQSQMNDLKKKRYIERVPENELDVKIRWYLPHHGVISERKQSKLRIVFDGSAEIDGISINNLLMKGPDLTNRLDGVLLRFREYPVAVSSDIQAMFHQIQVPPEDRNWSRFLWVDDQGQIEDWRWTVHPFGSKPSPAIACHALNHGLEEQADDRTRESCIAAKQTFYVDDHFDSFIDTERAAKHVKCVDETCQRSGFLLRKYASNHPEIINCIPQDRHVEIGSEVSLTEDCKEMPTLGMNWKPESDKLTYRAPDLKEVKTRRELLSNMTKLFDPLGLVSPWIFNCRLIVQNLSRLKLNWDDPVPEDELRKWINWRDGTQAVTEIEFERCVTTYTPGPHDEHQLHVFGDASERAHGVAAYISTQSEDEIDSKLIYARSRLNPQKGETMPRAELVAATLGAKTTAKLKKELRLPLQKSVNWTDSTIVLEHLRNETIQTSVFVRNRVGTILTLTRVEDLRHVQGRENPADIASRGGTARDLRSSLWQHGPEFLRLPEEISVNRIEGQSAADKGEDHTISVLNRLSDWERILNLVQCMLKPFNPEDEVSTADARIHAKVAVLRTIQRMYYSAELQSLREKLTTPRCSKIRKLCPEIDKDGLLRVGGRLNNSLLPHEGRRPIILPGGEPLVRTLIRRIHWMEGHVGRNHVISSLRERYWVTGVTVAVKQVLKDCVLCKKYQARLQTQKMGNLPIDRISAIRAFENSGVDYFGPLEVKISGRLYKRYGVLFSCNYTRAIHLELTRKLDTQSCLLAISRFTNRRGRPRKLRSDNGSNLVGASKELKQDLLKLNKELRLQEKLAKEEIDWAFNPPLERNKWQDAKSDLQQDYIVVLQDTSVGRAYWPVGRIVNIHKGSDGHVRSCEVRTQNGTYRRPITKLAKLLEAED